MREASQAVSVVATNGIKLFAGGIVAESTGRMLRGTVKKRSFYFAFQRLSLPLEKK